MILHQLNPNVIKRHVNFEGFIRIIRFKRVLQMIHLIPYIIC